MSRLLTAAQRAFDQTGFYAGLYGTRPDNPSQIPFINHAHYHRAAGLLDCITDRSLVSGCLPAFHRNGRRFPFNIVESDTEQQQRHQRLLHSLRSIGITAEAENFLLIADDATGSLAGEIATCLAWEHHRASIAYHHGDDTQLRKDIDGHAPGCLIQLSPTLGRWPRDWFPCPTLTVHSTDHPLPDTDNVMLTCDEIGIFAAGRTPAEPFIHETENLLIEMNPLTGLPAFTTVNFGIFPFIRYSPGHFPIAFDA